MNYINIFKEYLENIYYGLCSPNYFTINIASIVTISHYILLPFAYSSLIIRLNYIESNVERLIKQ